MSDRVAGNFDIPEDEQRPESTQDNGVKHLYLDNDLVPDRDAASRWYGDVDKETLEMDLNNTLDHIVEKDNNLLSMDRESAGDEIRKFMTYLNLDRDESQEFINALNSGLTSDFDTRKNWQSETRKQLNREYDTDAGGRLQAAEDAIMRYPDLQAFLRKHNLGNNPDLVGLIAKKAPMINARYHKSEVDDD